LQQSGNIVKWEYPTYSAFSIQFFEVSTGVSTGVCTGVPYNSQHAPFNLKNERSV